MPQAQNALGMQPWDYYGAHPEDGAAFSKAMANRDRSSVVLLGERHLRTVIREYVAHYHAERTIRASGTPSSLRP